MYIHLFYHIHLSHFYIPCISSRSYRELNIITSQICTVRIESSQSTQPSDVINYTRLRTFPRRSTYYTSRYFFSIIRETRIYAEFREELRMIRDIKAERYDVTTGKWQLTSAEYFLLLIARDRRTTRFLRGEIRRWKLSKDRTKNY